MCSTFSLFSTCLGKWIMHGSTDPREPVKPQLNSRVICADVFRQPTARVALYHLPWQPITWNASRSSIYNSPSSPSELRIRSSSIGVRSTTYPHPLADSRHGVYCTASSMAAIASFSLFPSYTLNRPRCSTLNASSSRG